MALSARVPGLAALEVLPHPPGPVGPVRPPDARVDQASPRPGRALIGSGSELAGQVWSSAERLAEDQTMRQRG